MKGSSPDRGEDGFAPIESYGVIGDGKSAALVALDGSIDWWAAPALDSPPLFAALLDPSEGGRFVLEPAVRYRVRRRYLPGTNLLETTFITRRGTVRVTDSINQAVDGRLPWGELVREIHGVRGKVPMRWRVAAGTLLEGDQPHATSEPGPVVRAGDLMVSLVTDGLEPPCAGPAEFSGSFTTRPGQDALLALVAAESSPVVVPSPADLRSRREATETAWRDWAASIPYDGPDAELVTRSVLALRMLTYVPTGAMAAAVTTSLPEQVGGERNFDYRYGWIRDTSFVLDALIQLGLGKQVQGTLAWMLGAIRQTAPDIHPFYGLRGDTSQDEKELTLRGYRDSQPARHGNSAADQPQWGNYGDLLECVWLAVDRAGAILDTGSADLIVSLANRVCEIWTEPDCGIWELDERRHNTFSKAGCWVALDRALRLASRGQIPGRDASRWAAERDAIREWIDENCWSDDRRSYLAHPGSDDLDAALLLLGRTGFCDDDDERFRSTIDAIEAELCHGPLVYRLSGASSYEGAFTACSFWLIDALTRTRQVRRARRLWREIKAYVNDLGLLSEEIDPSTGAYLGNLPQGLSHLALVNAAVQLNRAGRRRKT